MFAHGKNTFSCLRKIARNFKTKADGIKYPNL